MKYPRVVVWAFDGWLETQLGESVAERKWLLQSVHTHAEWVKATGTGGPCVAVVQADPTGESEKPLAAVGELHRHDPAVDVVVVCDVKLNDEDRPPWTAAALDLGARLVLYPPLTKTVLEDAVVGLMEHKVGSPPPAPKEEEIDLAAGNFEAE
jgi:hypothetical protein